ncbi:sensor histidine kinase [Methylolobus aquaticus]
MTPEGDAGGSAGINQGCSRQSLEALLCAIPLRLGLLDLELRFVWVGPGLGRALGFDAEDCLGRSIREVAPALADWLEPLIAELLATVPAVGARAFTVGNCPGDESDDAGRVELRLVTAAGGGIIGVAIVVSPAASALLDARRLVATRESAWCKFVERFAHDLRNPLTPILAAAQLLRRHGVAKAEIVEWAAVAIERQVRQLNSRLDDVVALAQAKQGALVVTEGDLDLGAILEQVIAEFLPLVQAGGLMLETDFPRSGLPVRGEKVRLERILGVLLTRAIDTTPSGGNIKIQAVKKNDQILVRVHDSGVGFETMMSESVFDPFGPEDPSSQTRRNHNDHVGLALARALVRRMQGSLTAFSAGMGRGAEFVLRLPIADTSHFGEALQDAPQGNLSSRC